MTNEIATTEAASPDQAMTRSWPQELRKLNAYGGIVVGWIPAPISEAARSWISTRTAHIDTQLAATDDREEATKAIVGLLSIYPGNPTPDQAKLRLAAYLMALDDRPAWAIKAAARRWLKGDVDVSDQHQLDFAPLTATLRRLAGEAVDGLAAEKARLAQIAAAKVRPIPAPTARSEPKTFVSAERVNEIREQFGFRRM